MGCPNCSHAGRVSLGFGSLYSPPLQTTTFLLLASCTQLLFRFHQLRIEDPITLYSADAWRLVDSALVSELCLTVASYIQPDCPRRLLNRFQPYPNDTPSSASASGSLGDRICFQPSQSGLTASSTRRFPGLCDHWNSRPGGCIRHSCRFSHACNGCGNSGHGAFECTATQSARS